MPTYPLQHNDLVEIQIVGRLDGQRTRNVFHYRFNPEVTEDDGIAGLTAALGDFETRVLEPLLAVSSNAWHVESCTIQKVASVRYRAIQSLLAVSGDIEEDALPSGCSAVLSLYALDADRQSQGRKFFSGIPISQEANSILLEEYVLGIQTVGDAMMTPLSTGDVETLYLTLTTPTSPHSVTPQWDVVQTVARNIVRYQRRREVGVGE